MKYEQQLLWIIPNGDYENLEDGNPIFYPFILGNRDHRNKAKDFCEKYNSHPSFFGVCVQPDGDLAYSSSNGFRNLKIEAMISGKAPNNAIDLFYDEISLQKEKLNGIRKG